MLAAIRAGITTILIPEQNKKDLEEIPKHILKKIEAVPVRTIDDVLKLALEQYPPPPATAESAPVKPKPTHRRVAHQPKVVS